MSNAAFRMLVEVAAELTDDEDTERVLAGAVLNHSLFLNHLDEPQRYCVAVVLAGAAARLRERLLNQPHVDGWSLSFASSLPVLQMWLEGLIGEADGSA